MAAVLSEEEELELRTHLMTEYTRYLYSLLKDAGQFPEFCASEVYMPYVYFLKDGIAVNKDVEGSRMMPFMNAVFTPDEFADAMGRYGIDVYLNEVTMPTPFVIQSADVVLSLALNLDLCQSRYFVVSVRILEIGNPQSHQTILLFDKEKKECIAIEPHISSPYVMQLYKFFLERVGLTEYTLIEPPEVCVQAVAKDKNCMFWSLILITRYLEENFPTINAVHKAIMDTHPTDKELKIYVDAFKYDLHKKAKAVKVPNVPSPGAPVYAGGKKTKGTRNNTKGDKWASSMGSRRKSHKHHLRHLRKSKSRHSRNARRTRRRA